MAEYTKYESLIVDLNAIETQVSVLNSKYKDIADRNRELEKMVQDLRSENTILLQKISKLEKDLKGMEAGSQELFNSFAPGEREEIRAKLQGFLEKIEYHLSS